MMMIAFRTVGWNVGEIREFTGAAADLGAQAKGAMKGQMPQMTHRQAYAIMMPIVIALMGSIYQKLHTGDWPDGVKDMYYPRTGLIRPDGSDERVALPSYMKDIYAYGKHPLTTLSHKTHPIFSMISDIVNNQDRMGNQIRQNPDDSLMDQATDPETYKDLGGYILKQLRPFSLSNLEQRKLAEPPEHQGGIQNEEEPNAERPTFWKNVESMFGVTPAPATVSRTDAENLMSEKLGKMIPPHARKKYEADRIEDLKQVLDTYRTKGLEAAEAQAAVDPNVRQSDIRDLIRKNSMSHLAYGTKRLDLDDALDVYRAGTDTEKEEIRPIIQSKIRTLGRKSPAEQDHILEKMDKMGLSPNGLEAPPQ